VMIAVSVMMWKQARPTQPIAGAPVTMLE